MGQPGLKGVVGHERCGGKSVCYGRDGVTKGPYRLDQTKVSCSFIHSRCSRQVLNGQNALNLSVV